jgi:hypothetical protein
MEHDITLITFFKRLQHFAIDFEYSDKIFIPELSGVNREDIEVSGGVLIDEEFGNYSFQPTLGPAESKPTIRFTNSKIDGFISEDIDIDQYSNYRMLVSFLHTRDVQKKITEEFRNLELPAPLTKNSRISDLIKFLAIPKNSNFLNSFDNINRDKVGAKQNLETNLLKYTNPAVSSSLDYIFMDLHADFSDEIPRVYKDLKAGHELTVDDIKRDFFPTAPEFDNAEDAHAFLIDEYGDEDYLSNYIPFLMSDANRSISLLNDRIIIKPDLSISEQADMGLYFGYDSGHDKDAISPLVDKSRMEALYNNNESFGGTNVLDSTNNSHIWSILENHIIADQKLDDNLKDLFLFGEHGGDDSGKGLINALEHALDGSSYPLNLSFLSDFMARHTHQDIESLYYYLSSISKTTPSTPIEYIKKEVKSTLSRHLSSTPISFKIKITNDIKDHDFFVDPTNPTKSILSSVSDFMSSNSAKSIDALLDDLDNDAIIFAELPGSSSDPSFLAPIKENFKKALLSISENPNDNEAQIKAFNYQPDLGPIVAKLPPSFFAWIRFTEQNNRKETIRDGLQQYLDNGTLTVAESSHILNSHLIPSGPVDGNSDIQKIDATKVNGNILKELELDKMNITSAELNAIDKLLCSNLSELSLYDIELISSPTLQSLVQNSINKVKPEYIRKLSDKLGVPNLLLVINNKLDFFNGALERAHEIKDNPHGNKAFEKTQSLSLDDNMAEHSSHAKELIPEPPKPKKILPKHFKKTIEKFTDTADKSNSMTELDNALLRCSSTNWMESKNADTWTRLKTVTSIPYMMGNDLLGVISDDKFGNSKASMDFLKQTWSNEKGFMIAKMASLASGDTEAKSTALRFFENFSEATGAQWTKDIVETAKRKNEESSKEQLEALETYIRNYKKIKYRDITAGTAPLTSKTTVSTNLSSDPLSEITNLRDFSRMGSSLNYEIKTNTHPEDSRRNLNNLNEKNFKLLGRSPSISAQDFIKTETEKDEDRDKNQRRNLIIAELQRERENMANISISPPKSIRIILDEFRDAVVDGTFTPEEGKALIRSFAPEQTQIYSVAGNDFDDFFNAVSRPVENKRSSADDIMVSDHELSVSRDPSSPRIILDSTNVLSFKTPRQENGKYQLNKDNTLVYDVELTADSGVEFRDRLKGIDPVHLLRQVSCGGNPESYIKHLELITEQLGGDKLALIYPDLPRSAMDSIQSTIFKAIGISSDDIDNLIIRKLPAEATNLKRPDRPTNHRILKALYEFNKSISPELFTFKPSKTLIENFHNSTSINGPRTIDELSGISVRVDSIDAQSGLSPEDDEDIRHLTEIEVKTGKMTSLFTLNESYPNLYALHVSQTKNLDRDNAINDFSHFCINSFYINHKTIDFGVLGDLYKKHNNDNDYPNIKNLIDKFPDGITIQQMKSEHEGLFILLTSEFASANTLSDISALIKPTTFVELMADSPIISPLFNNILNLRDDYISNLATRAYSAGILDVDPSTITNTTKLVSNLKGIRFPDDDDTLDSLQADILKIADIFDADEAVMPKEDSFIRSGLARGRATKKSDI